MYGLPLVMYELPFVEFCRDKRGYISVPQGDKGKLADALIKVLQDDEFKQQLQVGARESIADFREYDIKSEWAKVFAQVREGFAEEETDEDLKEILQSLLHHYSYGARMNRKEKAKLHNKLKAERKIRRSLEYRLGRILLYIPRRILRMIRR